MRAQSNQASATIIGLLDFIKTSSEKQIHKNNSESENFYLSLIPNLNKGKIEKNSINKELYNCLLRKNDSAKSEKIKLDQFVGIIEKFG